MARITVEQALDRVGNRFDLVLLAAKRARQIARYGKEPLIETDNDKSTVIALKEIELGAITKEQIDAIERGANEADAEPVTTDEAQS